MISSLVKLTENDKRLIAAFLLLLILVFVIVGLIVNLIIKIMKSQGDYIDKAMHDMVVSKVVEDPKSFRRIAFIKSRQKLFLSARIPAIILLVSGALTLIFGLIYHANNWTFDFFQYNNGTANQGGSGFNTLFFIWNYAAPESEMIPKTFEIFGMKVQIMQPPLINTPHLSVAAIPAYIISLGILVGVVWFLLCVQAYVARTIRIFKLSKSVYSKSLEDFNASKNTFENKPNAPNENKE